jgi:hypothetical protein
MVFWEALFAVGLALGGLLFASFRRVPRTPLGVALLLGGSSIFVVRLLQAGPYVAPRGFDLLVGAAAIVLGGILMIHRSQGRHAIPVARLAVALTPLALIGTAIATIHEIGEIVTLRTTDARGGIRETRLAFVDYDGATWVGAGSGEERRWYQDLAAHPRVELVRGGAVSCRIAKPVKEPAIRDEVCRRLEEKYLSGRVAAAFGSHLFLNPEAIPIRLDPCAQ